MATGKRGAKAEIKKTVDTTDALALRASGMSYRAIGQQLGIGKSTAHEHVQEGLAVLAEAEHESALMLRGVLQERLNLAYSQLHPKVSKGDLQAIKLWLQAVETEARIFGLTTAPPVVIQNNIVLRWPEAPAAPAYQPDDVVIMGAINGN